MKVDHMRKIDRYFGIPLTFFVSIPIVIIRLFRKKTKPVTDRTLFIELSEMGSALLVDPAMRKLRSAGPAELFFVIFRANVKSLEILQTVPAENIFPMRSENMWLLAVDVFRFMRWCRRKKITCVIDLELFSRFTALLAAFSMARHRVGFTNLHDEGLYRGSIVNIPVRYNPHVHISKNFMSLVNSALGLNTHVYSTYPVAEHELKITKLPIDLAGRGIVQDKIKGLYPAFTEQRVFLLNVNASDMLPQRRWLPDRFAYVAREILSRHDDVLIVATGSPNEKDYVQHVVDLVAHDRCVNSSGVFQFEELVHLYGLSQLMLTNDSGPAHFASVTELKVFVIFGPETPALYMPLGNAEAIFLGLPCSPCVSAANHRKTTCPDRPCITGIDAISVLQKVDHYLSSKVIA